MNTSPCVRVARFKDVHFADAGLGFELPKQLALSNVALRILHTRYDHLSPRARLHALEPRPPGTRYLPPTLPDPGMGCVCVCVCVCVFGGWFKQPHLAQSQAD